MTKIVIHPKIKRAVHHVHHQAHVVVWVTVIDYVAEKVVYVLKICIGSIVQ